MQVLSNTPGRIASIVALLSALLGTTKPWWVGKINDFPTYCPTGTALLIGLSLFCLSSASAKARADEGLNEASTPIRSEKNLVYRQIDGRQLRADMYRPANDRVYPLIVMIHGGAWSAGDKWDLTDHAREMAQAGFVAVSVNYRLAPKAQIDAQIDDCRTALRWAAAQAEQWKADSSRCMLWGYSAGAQLAALLTLDPRPDEPKILAVAIGGAPCEFSFVGENSRVLAHVMGGTRLEVPEVYRRTSPLEFANKNAPPFFFYHGSSDLVVQQQSSQFLYEKLKSMSVPVEYYQVEGRGHLLTFLDTQARRRAIAFLKNILKDTP